MLLQCYGEAWADGYPEEMSGPAAEQTGVLDHVVHAVVRNV